MFLADPIATARLLHREVRNGIRNGEPTKIVVGRRTYPTTASDLWDALTNRDRIPRWFLPISGDLVEGGRYQLEGNAGGTIERCQRPTLLAVTWEFGGGVSWLEVELTPTTDGTTLELRHEAPVIPEFWDTYGPGAVGLGWDLSFVGLGLHLESGEAVDPAQAEAFSLSPEGATFFRTAGEDWRDAAIAAGDEPATAATAAEAAIAFYTVVPEAPAEE